MGTSRFSAIRSLVVLSLLSSPLQAQTSIRFAAVGDYGTAPAVRTVADMIASWNPDFVITLGDNNYTPNNATTASWDNEVGQFFGQYIKYPVGSTSAYAPGPSVNKFFPCVGNHDWDADISGWYNYFELPSNERYFDFVKGPVHFFVIDSDVREPDGTTTSSVQAQWLHAALSSSNSRWNVVYFHHPPYTSSSRGNNTALQWPFKQWGATAVLNGHEHQYERIILSGFPYIVNGTGGQTLSGFSTPIPGSVFRYNANYGAMLIEAGPDSIEFKLYSISSGGTPIDRYAVHFSIESTLVDQGSTWKYLDDNSDQGTAWRLPGFNDASWPSGPAKLGFGGDGEVTTTNGGPSGNRYITTYFRRSFFFGDATRIAAMTLDVLRDDGAVVYLNGTELWRTNMPSGTITRSTFASTTVGGVDENTFFSTQPSSPVVLPGQNVVAVEVHQSNLTSSDLGFDLRLSATLIDNPLPIQLASFTARATGDASVQLEWMTLSEVNNYGFFVQRRLSREMQFADVPNGFVPGHGTTQEPHHYDFLDVRPGTGEWVYRLKQVDLDGNVHFSDGVEVLILSYVTEPFSPPVFSLQQNYPNPFNPSTEIRFSVEATAPTTLFVYNVLGQQVTTLFHDIAQAGHDYKVKLDGSHLASGIYFYRLQSNGRTNLKKMLLVK